MLGVLSVSIAVAEEPDEPAPPGAPVPAALAAERDGPMELSDAGPDERRRGRGMSLADQAYRERRHVIGPSFTGGAGGFRVVDAGSGAPATTRIMLGFELFQLNNWLEADRSHFHAGNVTSVGLTPFSFMELHVRTAAWRNSTYRSEAPYFQRQADTQLGVKLFGSPVDWLYLGGEVEGRFPMSMVSDVPAMARAIGATFRASLSTDFRDLPRPVPLLVRLNAAYRLDNSAMLLRDLERDRYDALPEDLDPARRPLAEEDRHRISRLERQALRIDRTDFVQVAVGFEAPIRLRATRMTLSPIAEWWIDVPVNRQGFTCPEGGASPGLDPCGLGQVASLRQAAVVGARLTPAYGFSIFAAAEVGLTGVNPVVQEIAPQPPYQILAGFSYAFDVLYYRTQQRQKAKK